MRKTTPIILSAADTASQTGAALDTNQTVSASFVPYCGDATAVGTVKIQASNDACPNDYMGTVDFTPTNWADIPNASSAITSGAGPAILIPNMCFRWIRAVYTRTSGGSSTITVAAFVLSI